eukprot:1321977-Pleurochrysis_carterae.AAC.1
MSARVRKCMRARTNVLTQKCCSRLSHPYAVPPRRMAKQRPIYTHMRPRVRPAHALTDHDPRTISWEFLAAAEGRLSVCFSLVDRRAKNLLWNECSHSLAFEASFFVCCMASNAIERGLAACAWNTQLGVAASYFVFCATTLQKRVSGVCMLSARALTCTCAQAPTLAATCTVPPPRLPARVFCHVLIRER